jgi:threonine dehydratase
LVHPYDDDAVIAGQATAAVELIEQAPGLEVVACPIGGGGLVSGTALATRWLLPDARVIAGEPAGADDAWRSLQAGAVTPAERIDTIADGLRALIAPRTFAVIAEHVSEIVTVPDEAIVGAMKLIWTAMKIVVEPSSAVPLAALLKVRPAIAGRRVGVILTGGNVDLDALPW